MKDATKEFKEWLEKKNTLDAKRSLEVLNKDVFIILDYGDTYRLTPTTGLVKIPDYVYSQYELFKKEKGHRKRFKFKIEKIITYQKIEYGEQAKDFVQNFLAKNKSTKVVIEDSYFIPVILERGTINKRHYYIYYLFIPCNYGTLIYKLTKDNATKPITFWEAMRFKSIREKLFHALRTPENEKIVKKIFTRTLKEG